MVPMAQVVSNFNHVITYSNIMTMLMITCTCDHMHMLNQLTCSLVFRIPGLGSIAKTTWV